MTPALERAEVSRGSSPSSPQARSPHLGKVRVWNNRTLGDEEKGVKAEGFGQLVKQAYLPLLRSGNCFGGNTLSCIWVSQGTAFESWFAPSTMQVPVLELTISQAWENTFKIKINRELNAIWTM